MLDKKNLLILAPGCIIYNLLEMYSEVFDNVTVLGQTKYKSKFDITKKQLKKIDNIDMVLTSQFKYIPTALNLIKIRRIDAIIAHDPKAGLIAYFLKRLTRTKVIFQMCQDFLEYLALHRRNLFLKPVVLSLNSLMLRLSSKNFFVLALSNHIKKRAIAYGAKNVEVIPVPGINMSLFHKKKTMFKKKIGVKGPLIFTVGRLTPEKGTINLIKAMLDILASLPSSHLLIIGNGYLEHDLKELVKKLNIEGSVTFKGFTEHSSLPEIYSAADIFVLPSLKEGLGYVSGEAMACETPVVATNTGGIPDVIINGKTGLLVEPGDSSGLANAILKVLKDKKLATRLVKNAKKHIKENFEEKIITEKLREFISSLK